MLSSLLPIDLPRLALHILFIAPSAYPLGGVQIWLDYLMPGLEARGKQVTLGLVDGDHHRAGIYLDHHPWAQTVLIRNPTGSPEGRVRALLDCIDQTQPDLIVSVNIGDSLEAISRLRRRGQLTPRLVMTVHGIEPDYFGDLVQYQSVIDGVVVTNRLTEAMVPELSTVASERCHYAPYGVAAGAERVASGDATLRVLWMGRLEQLQKRVLELPDIVKELARQGIRTELTVAGDGPERDALERGFDSVEARTLVSIQMLGVVEHDRLLAEFLPASDVLLVNSAWETGPITIWEAMAAQVPVVSSRYVGSGLENSLKDGANCLLFDIGDIGHAAQQLARLSQPDSLGETLTRRAFETVQTRYTRPVSVQAWCDALEAIYAGPPVPDGKLPLPGKASAGRLDRLLGASLAERFRRLAGRRFRHMDAGGEWPHARVGAHGLAGGGFSELAEKTDRGAAG